MSDVATVSSTTAGSSSGNAAAPSGDPSRAKTRFGFIDLLRGFALVVMIETHVINAYIPYAARHTWLFFWLTFFNGLVAPTFLFASGFSVVLQANRQWDDWLRLGPAFWRQMRRVGFIVLVAYYTHLDHLRLSRYLYPQEPDLWRRTLQVDVLQCIVASLLIVHLLIFALRRRGAVALAAGILAVAILLSTPWVWSHDFAQTLPLGLALFLNPHGVSLFPLFPWTTFFLTGCCASYLFLAAVERRVEVRYIKTVTVVGAAAILFGYLGQRLPFTLPGVVNYYTTSPLYVVLRLGCVAIVLALLFAWERSGRWLPQAVRIAGQESLLVYGVHLWLIFGVLRGKHSAPVIGLEKGYLWCFAVSALVIAFMLWLAGVWNGLKKKFPGKVRAGQAIVVTAILLTFLLR
jgi:uncharacterized membrane protein